MSAVIAISLTVGALMLVVVRALAVDEARGRIQRRIRASVDATIASMPQELQDEWGEEWRAELQELLHMPLTAAVYARNLRASARQLVNNRVLEPAVAVVPRTPHRMGRPRPRLAFSWRPGAVATAALAWYLDLIHAVFRSMLRIYAMCVLQMGIAVSTFVFHTPWVLPLVATVIIVSILFAGSPGRRP